MRVIMKCPDENLKIGELASFNDIRDFIGGSFETVPFLCSDGSKYLIVCSDSFLFEFDESKFNTFLGGVPFFGNFFICSGLGFVNGEYDFVGLSAADILAISDNLCWSDYDRCFLKSFVAGEKGDTDV